MKISKKAFTLVELVVVLLIISVLAVLGFINYSNYVATGRDSKIIEDLDVISRAINMNLSY
jgi:prepilin-type cleavage/methylation N-terminal domain protein